MSEFTSHTIESAPEKSKPLLDKSLSSFGMIPGLHAVMAEAPELLEGYQRLHQLFQNTSFDNDELTVIWQTINVEHECHYCVPAHTFIAKSMSVDDSITEALRDETALPSKKLQVLHDTTLKLVRNRGHLTEEDLSEFHSVGYGNQQLLEIVLGIAQKVMSNYTNHLAKTPVDEPFRGFSWEKQSKS